jgi:hypothetical protein
MANENSRALTSEDTQKLLADRATKEGGDDFTVKVFRKAHFSQPPTLIATLSGANVGHFISSELWIPPLCGGGKYMLQGYHATDMNKAVGGYVAVNIESQEPREVNAAAMSKPDWRGPPILDFPQKEAPRNGNGHGDLGPLYNVHSPPAPGSGDSANGQTQAWPRQAGGGLVRQDYDNGNGRSPTVAALESERRSLENARRELDLEKHKAEMDNVKKAHEADMRAFEAKMLSMVTQSKPQGPDSTLLMMQEMMKQASEDRRAAQQQAAEDRRAAAERQERADARFTEMMLKLNDRPKENPLDMLKTAVELMGSKKNDGMIEAQTKMLHSMSEMTSQQIGVAMDFVSAAADMQLGGGGGEKEPGWVKALDKVMKGVGAMAKGAAMRPQMQPPMMQQQMLPAPPQTYEQQALAQPPQTQQVQAQPQQPAPQPQQAAQPRPPQQETDKSVIAQIEEAIRAKFDTKQVAAALIAYFQDPSIQEALEEAEGDFEVVLQKRLGSWSKEAPSNEEYLKTLFAEVEKQIEAAGLKGDDSDDGDEGDDE